MTSSLPTTFPDLSAEWEGSPPATPSPTAAGAPTAPAAARQVTGAGFDPSQRASVARDLAYAAALLEAGRRMQVQPDLPSLLSTIATEAATLIYADDVAVVRFRGIRRQVVSVHCPTHIDDLTFLQAVNAAAEERWMIGPGSTHDLAEDRRWSSRRGPLAAVAWRSTMTVAVASPSRDDAVRLVWFSREPRAFEGQTRTAELVSGQADLAIHSLADRTNLTLAIEARHRVGLAQGILMARHQLTTEQAFRILQRESQNTNVKLHTIADQVIGTAAPR